MNKLEQRAIAVGGFEIREDGASRTVAGHAAKFNVFSEDMGYFREKIAPGAFSGSLDGDIRALWSHNFDQVLGRTKNGTLRLSEDNIGLRFELDLPDTALGRDAFTLIKRGDVSGMSFGFFVKKDSWERGAKGEQDVRTLEQVELFEVSPVAWPAYPDTDVQARSLQEIAERGKKVLQQSTQTTGKSIALALRELNLFSLHSSKQ